MVEPRRVGAGPGPPTIGAHPDRLPSSERPTRRAAADRHSHAGCGTPKWCPHTLQGLDAIQMSKPQTSKPQNSPNEREVGREA